jgi:predicted nucleic acid-binding protein
MSAEFVDTDILVYAHDASAGEKYEIARRLIARLTNDGIGATSTQVLAEFYSVAIRKTSILWRGGRRNCFRFWIMAFASSDARQLLQSIAIQRKFRINRWEALIVNSALELGCSTLWTEDLKSGQRFSTLTARNPFA